MLYFNCDYNEGAHPRILELLAQTNMEQTVGYGCDPYCDKARDLIRAACDAPDAEVQFLVGGTQANAIVICAALRPHQGVISADAGHINVHETGAVEATGHKVLALPSVDGKITAEQVEKCYINHINDDSFEHIVQPKMVYLSQPNEYGALYTLAELEAISSVCHKNGMFLFVDGARMGYGLAAKGNDVFLPDLARLCDVFYIGGTKMGALFGEAVVITNPILKEDFRYIIKQRGAMLAKGRLLGLQFVGLMENDLYTQLGRHADALADKIRNVLLAKKVPFMVKNTTNQLFPILPDSILEKLNENFCSCYMGRIDETHSGIRFCTSWATPESAVDELCAALEELL